MKLKNRYEDYTEAEFLAFLEEIFENKHDLDGDEYGEYINKLVKHFDDISGHPEKNALIFYPEKGVEDSPAGVLKALKSWRAANGKPGFKKG